MNKALKASWVNRFKNDISSPWKIIPDYMAHRLGGFKFLLSCTYKRKELTLDNIPLFYLEVLKHWELINKVMSNCDEDKVDISKIIIWNNTDVKIDGKPMFCRSWYQCGVEKVEHLLDDSGNNFRTYENLIDRYTIKTNFTTYYGLLRAVRSKWKLSLLATQKQTPRRNWFNSEENFSNAALHKIIVNYKFEPPSNETRIISYGIDPSELSSIYKWPFTVTKNVKLAMFQFKINHNIIYTKDKLKKANLTSDDLCYLCKKERHTLEHMLPRCSNVVKFWKEFYSWWSQITKENITLPDRTLLYGPVQPGKHQLVLSSALLIAKYFIYKCSLTEELLVFELFKLQFYDHGMTERYLAIKTDLAVLLTRNGNHS